MGIETQFVCYYFFKQETGFESGLFSAELVLIMRYLHTLMRLLELYASSTEQSNTFRLNSAGNFVGNCIDKFKCISEISIKFMVQNSKFLVKWQIVTGY